MQTEMHTGDDPFGLFNDVADLFSEKEKSELFGQAASAGFETSNSVRRIVYTKPPSVEEPLDSRENESFFNETGIVPVINSVGYGVNELRKGESVRGGGEGSLEHVLAAICIYLRHRERVLVRNTIEIILSVFLSIKIGGNDMVFLRTRMPSGMLMVPMCSGGRKYERKKAK